MNDHEITEAAVAELVRYTKGDNYPSCPSCSHNFTTRHPATQRVGTVDATELRRHAETCATLRRDVAGLATT